MLPTTCEDATPRHQQFELPHVLEQVPVKVTCTVRKDYFEAVIDNRKRLALKMEILSHLEYISRQRKTGFTRDGRKLAGYHSLTEKYWAKVTKKHPETIRLALNELEAEQLIERVAVYDELGSPLRRLRNRGFPNRNKMVRLNVEVINARMQERVNDLRTTSLSNFAQPLCTENRVSGDLEVCVVQEKPNPSDEGLSVSIFSGNEEDTSPVEPMPVSTKEARKGNPRSRAYVWKFDETPHPGTWAADIAAKPLLLAMLVALGFTEITGLDARKWAKYLRSLTRRQARYVLGCLAARRQKGNLEDVDYCLGLILNYVKPDSHGDTRAKADDEAGGVELVCRHEVQMAFADEYSAWVAGSPATRLAQCPTIASYVTAKMDGAILALHGNTDAEETQRLLAGLRRGVLLVDGDGSGDERFTHEIPLQ